MGPKRDDGGGDPCHRPWLVIGDVTRPHGVGGEVVVRPTTDFPERFAPGARLRVQQGRRMMELEVESVRPLARGLGVKFREVSDRNLAGTLRGAEVVIACEEARPLPEGSFYRHELVGLAVVEEGGAAIGELVDVLELPQGNLLVVVGDGGERYLPAVDEVVLDVDIGRGVVTVRLMEEME